jgi:hypothetical protein
MYTLKPKGHSLKKIPIFNLIKCPPGTRPEKTFIQSTMTKKSAWLVSTSSLMWIEPTHQIQAQQAWQGHDPKTIWGAVIHDLECSCLNIHAKFRSGCTSSMVTGGVTQKIYSGGLTMAWSPVFDVLRTSMDSLPTVMQAFRLLWTWYTLYISPLIWAHLKFAHYTPQVSQCNIVPWFSCLADVMDIAVDRASARSISLLTSKLAKPYCQLAKYTGH